MLWIEVWADAVVGVSLLFIGLVLLLVAHARRGIPALWHTLAWLAGGVTAATGAIHLTEVWTLWSAHGWVACCIKVLAGLAALAGATALPLLLPGLLSRARPPNGPEGPQAQMEALHRELEALRAQLHQAHQAQQARREASQAQRTLARARCITALGEMAASVAHEVNQPLAAIVVNANACERWLAPPLPNLEEAREAIRRIARDAHRASEVVTRRHAFVRRVEPSRIKVALGQLVQATAALGQDQAREAGVVLRVEEEAALPPVQADRLLLQQVLFNLIENGIEACAGRAGEGRVEVSARHGVDGGVQVEVRDNGAGLPPQPSDQAFAAFHTTKPGRMGLGLASCRAIVETHGGQLWVRPHAEGGTSFGFNLPSAARVSGGQA
ncbi:ATP-binding protein [Aquabacterium sp. A7-Y]|uniref:sensor histidine kinase n=1 Tax=Aquabacterium sp. A7-Y TaxID=1349605 RepID=UPI00223E3B4A|nr:ATP-binding protein [Aquabacterium sp. A7-Y]MCW7540849.1 ATP-binding protein [Aquabacterium sp. A7-Y]